jgi:hypothetical protein
LSNKNYPISIQKQGLSLIHVRQPSIIQIIAIAPITTKQPSFFARKCDSMHERNAHNFLLDLA